MIPQSHKKSKLHQSKQHRQDSFDRHQHNSYKTKIPLRNMVRSKFLNTIVDAIEAKTPPAAAAIHVVTVLMMSILDLKVSIHH